MEITLRIVLDLSPAVSAAVEALRPAAIAAPCRPAPEQPARLNQQPQLNQLNQQPEPQPEQPRQQPLPEPQPEQQQPEPEQPKQQPKPEPQQPEQQQQQQPEQPAPEYKEKPEDVLPLLRDRFGIPAAKEERTEEQQNLAKALNKAVVAVIREVTKNGAARSIADLRTEDDRQEFIRLSLLLYYNVSTQQFEVKPF